MIRASLPTAPKAWLHRIFESPTRLVAPFFGPLTEEWSTAVHSPRLELLPRGGA